MRRRAATDLVKALTDKFPAKARVACKSEGPIRGLYSCLSAMRGTALEPAEPLQLRVLSKAWVAAGLC